jgi:hypothetical protein
LEWEARLRQTGPTPAFFVENDEPKDAVRNLADSYTYFSKLHF